MSLGDEIVIFKNWFIINFVENPGMAFGYELSGKYGKLLLSISRILLVIVIGWSLSSLYKKKGVPLGFIASVSLILAGAIGNIIDSVFYGVIFDHSYGQVAAFLPEGGGYASFLHGKVVDMFYFPLFGGTYPSWFPVIGGTDFLFFRPVFNVADSSITIGIFSIALFYWKKFNTLYEKQEKTETNEESSMQPTDEVNSVKETSSLD